MTAQIVWYTLTLEAEKACLNTNNIPKISKLHNSQTLKEDNILWLQVPMYNMQLVTEWDCTHNLSKVFPRVLLWKTWNVYIKKK